MNLIKYLVYTLSILISVISCDIIMPNNEESNINWSEGDYAYIDLEKNPEWETGIIAEDGRFLLVKKDTTNNGYIGYINSQEFDSEGIALYFNEEIELLSFVTNKGICYINRTQENIADILLVTGNEQEIYENIAISSTKIIETKAAPVIPLIVGIASGVATIKNLWDTIQATKKLGDGNWDGARLDYLKLLAGTAIKNPFGGFALDGAFGLLDKAKEDLDKKGQTCFLGNCQIQISKTKIGIRKFRIAVTVTGYETLPIISKVTGEKSVVFGGIAVARTPYVTINSNDQIIQDWVINGNGTNSVEFELPEDQTYYAIPYLLPTRGGKYEFRSNVRHGNTIKLPYFNGVVDEFKQLSYSENGDKYTFKCQAHAICNPKDDEFWKLYYEDDNGEKVFFDAKTYEEPSVTAPNSAEFEFEIELESNLFKDGKKDIKLGIATFTKSYFIMLASDPQIFELSTEVDRWIDLGLPSGILWAAYNIGASSPEEYGDYYAWGDTEIRSHFGGDDYVHLDPLTGDFINIGENICATEYDVANIKWGDGARMPRVEDIEELINNCSWTIRKLNSITGMHITGSNGNVIFLPFSGDEDSRDEPYGSLDYGHIWSGTRGATESDEAHALYYDDDGIIGTYLFDRDMGFTIRPVKDKETDTEN